MALGRMREGARAAEAAGDDGVRLKAYDAFVMAIMEASEHECLTDRGGLRYILAEAHSNLRTNLGLTGAVPGPSVRERLDVFEERFKREVLKG